MICIRSCVSWFTTYSVRRECRDNVRFSVSQAVRNSEEKYAPVCNAVATVYVSPCRKSQFNLIMTVGSLADTDVSKIEERTWLYTDCVRRISKLANFSEGSIKTEDLIVAGMIVSQVLLAKEFVTSTALWLEVRDSKCIDSFKIINCQRNNSDYYLLFHLYL